MSIAQLEINVPSGELVRRRFLLFGVGVKVGRVSRTANLFVFNQPDRSLEQFESPAQMSVADYNQ
jgi:hypothetical protein